MHFKTFKTHDPKKMFTSPWTKVNIIPPMRNLSIHVRYGTFGNSSATKSLKENWVRRRRKVIFILASSSDGSKPAVAECA